MELFAKTKQTAFSRYLFLQNALFPVFDRALNTTPALIIKAFKTAKFTGRSSDRYSVKKKVRKNLPNFTENTCVRVFLNKFAGLQTCNSIKKRRL